MEHSRSGLSPRPKIASAAYSQHKATPHSPRTRLAQLASGSPRPACYSVTPRAGTHYYDWLITDQPSPPGLSVWLHRADLMSRLPPIYSVPLPQVTADGRFRAFTQLEVGLHGIVEGPGRRPRPLRSAGPGTCQSCRWKVKIPRGCVSVAGMTRTSPSTLLYLPEPPVIATAYE